MNVYKGILAYDGTAWQGWQQGSSGSTIYEQLMKAYTRIAPAPPEKLQGASRTDSGVHALGQVFSLHTLHSHSDLLALKKSLNALLPPSIRVLTLDPAPVSFHPSLDATEKEYRYYLCNGRYQLPHLRRYSWHYSYPLSLPLIEQAIPSFLGTHNFQALCNYQPSANYTSYERTISALSCTPLPNQRLQFTVRGNAFLYKMVRNLVGTLLFVGRGEISVEAIPAILASKERQQAGITAAAHGLWLQEICYN